MHKKRAYVQWNVMLLSVLDATSSTELLSHNSYGGTQNLKQTIIIVGQNEDAPYAE